MVQPQPDPEPVSRTYPALLAYGFRPFFLLAGVHAAIAIPLWIAVVYGLELPPTAVPAPVWHAHEMLYGFIAAAMAGFLLTAVPSWTNRRGYAGAPLAMLVLLWLAGRMLMTIPMDLPALLVAAIDLAFVPALALTILPALLRSGNRRNLVFIGMLAILFSSNLHFHLAGAVESAPLLLGINAVLFLVTLLGGRVVPAFTSAGLKQLGLEARLRRYQPLDKTALFAVGAVLVVDLILPATLVAAAFAALAAVLLAAQLGHWQGHRTLSMPIVWVLHLAYAWLPICLALKAATLMGLPISGSSWLHAATAGAMATMIIGIMSRAALGHTGRPLVTPAAVVIAYLLLTAAALVRVFGPMLLPAAGIPWLPLAALLWCLAFLLYVVVYAPILCKPRIDGRPG
ncbi:MAG: NnrS family protein [Gammaproteobacteria bacterium]|nr:MAG: NnrS family protein [Gammaproteobacteria bacterium]